LLNKTETKSDVRCSRESQALREFDNFTHQTPEMHRIQKSDTAPSAGWAEAEYATEGTGISLT